MVFELFELFEILVIMVCFVIDEEEFVIVKCWVEEVGICWGLNSDIGVEFELFVSE